MNERELQRLDTRLEDKSSPEVEIDLMELFYRLIENSKRIIASALVGMLIFALYSFVLATPKYEATCKMYVASASDSAINLSDLQIGSYLTKDYQEVFDTWEVHEKVIQNLNLKYTYKDLEDMVKVSNPGDTRILYINFTCDDADEAAIIANEYANVASDYIALTMSTDKPTILSSALPPTKPVSPRKLFNTVVGLVLGALVMIVIITVQFLLDDKIKTAEDIRKYVDMPTLAVVPTNGEYEHGNRERAGKDGRKQRR